MREATITITAASGVEVTARPEVWIAALMVSLSAEQQAKVMALAAKYMEGPIVGGQPSMPVIHVPGLLVRKN